MIRQLQEAGTSPSPTWWMVNKAKAVFFIMQLCRENIIPNAFTVQNTDSRSNPLKYKGQDSSCVTNGAEISTC